MSDMYIKDGTGKGYQTKVNSDNRLHTDAVTQDIAANKAYSGDAYNINTGTISLTSDSESALLYLKNTGVSSLIVTALFYLIGNSDGTGDMLVQVLRNPTAGTIVDSGIDFEAINRHFGSSKGLTATIKRGAEGRTFTNGTVAIESIFNSVGRKVVSVGAVVLTQGTSIGIEMTPPSGTTALDVQMAIAVYEESDLGA